MGHSSVNEAEAIAHRRGIVRLLPSYLDKIGCQSHALGLSLCRGGLIFRRGVPENGEAARVWQGLADQFNRFAASSIWREKIPVMLASLSFADQEPVVVPESPVFTRLNRLIPR